MRGRDGQHQRLCGGSDQGPAARRRSARPGRRPRVACPAPARLGRAASRRRRRSRGRRPRGGRVARLDAGGAGQAGASARRRRAGRAARTGRPRGGAPGRRPRRRRPPRRSGPRRSGRRGRGARRTRRSLDDLVGDLVDGGEHAADAAGRGVVGHRAVGDGEVGLLEEAVAVDLEEDVLHPGGRAAVERRVDQRPDDVPDLGPALAGRLAQGPGCLAPEDREVGVVVELDRSRAPTRAGCGKRLASMSRTVERRVGDQDAMGPSGVADQSWTRSGGPSRRRPSQGPAGSGASRELDASIVVPRGERGGRRPGA